MQRPETLAALVERALAPLPTVLGGSARLTAFLDPAESFQAKSSSAVATGRPSYARFFVRVAGLIDGTIDEEDLEELTEGAKSYLRRPLAFRFARSADEAARWEIAEAVASIDIASRCSQLAKKGRSLVVVSLFDGEYVEPSRLGAPESSASGLLAVVANNLPRSSQSGSVFNSSLVKAGSGEAASDSRQDVAVVLPRVACRQFDSYDGLSVKSWVLHAMLPPVGRFDTETSSLYEKTMKPIFMLFADQRSPELPGWLATLHRAHGRYNRQGGQEEVKLMLVYVDGLQYMHRMTSVGLEPNPARLPALSLNFVTETTLTWQPLAEEYRNGTAVLTDAVVDELIQRFFHGDAKRAQEGAAPKAIPVPKRDTSKGERRDVPELASLSLQDRLRFVPAVNQDSFGDVVLDASKDVAVFFFSSSGPTEQISTEAAIFVNRCAERLEELKIKSAKVVRLDLSQFSAPTSVQISEIPSLVLFPAFSKDPPHQYFRGKFKVQHILWWLQAGASLDFKLPELPHLDDLEAKAYWEQKAELPEERQQRIAAASEGSLQKSERVRRLVDRSSGAQGGKKKRRARRRKAQSTEL
eukprot:TRINITY_DN29272_c0_g1_i3.p1 TRINITY_DN29272_c0_g1~~TRINITY_DN29272_c0_g1_i3.p1  ORF type:complete len:583 (+),score=135.63 TRINITY_DN29272_c0_g1_i3:354-2102(+)